MVSFPIHLEIMSKVGQYNETFKGVHKIQRRNITTLETNDSKTSDLFERVGNITSTSQIEEKCGIQKYS